MRKSRVTRKTNETDIAIELKVPGMDSLIDVPSGFFAHMLDALSRHSNIGMTIHAQGDVHVDLHHTVEDCGIVMGEAIRRALGDKKGIERYGSATIPMDEALVEVCLDISDRPYFQIHGPDAFHGKAGEFDMELVPEFFRSLAFNAGITLHITIHAYSNLHHLCEACFKAFARALKQAVEITGHDIPSTKGSL
ncbi:MAG: imidazoleglycerol-phosphate dehydratase HisB [Thermodesulfobacteriota bacterium]|nr:imidazoleglycerol-phosphate dehydratase HisB [Thermodesulfobacteriota bacterium]